MKYKLTSEEHSALDESNKGFYSEQNDSFILQVDGLEDHFVSKEKKDIAETHRKNAESRLQEAEAREVKLLKDIEKAKGGKDEIELIRNQHISELDKIRAEYQEKENLSKQESYKTMVQLESEKFAQEHFIVPSAIRRLFSDRLAVEEVNGQPVIRTKELDGTPSIKSIEDLKKEFLDNKEFSPIIKASLGSGSGAEKSEKGGNFSGAGKEIDVLTASPKDLVKAISQRAK
jgi:hypothetical protein